MKSFIYDTVMRPLTSDWYREVLERVPEGAHLLDIGIGTGGALARNAELLREKQLKITGVDIDAHYVKRAQKRFSRNDLSDLVQVRLESIYDHHGGPYDAVYFASSFMLLPEPERALRHAISLLKPGGRIYFTQTFEEKHAPLMEKVKPLLGRLTTMEFGRVTYEEDFLNVIRSAGLDVDEFSVMNRIGDRSFRIAVAMPSVGEPSDAA
ncbi:MAG: class I SAM-dependent methyltransferase [Gammaproteobacteria bacterium]|nr:class I SAM-dependent methyltransferase [Gammaproteobacteria bacterium]